jgi:hypothetical protein
MAIARWWQAPRPETGDAVRKFFDRLRRRIDPTDAETADAMRNLAEAFVAGSAEEGEPFGWESVEASRLDELCHRFLASRPSAAVRHSKVAKRLDIGPEHNLFQFYWYALTNEVPPQSNIRTL